MTSHILPLFTSSHLPLRPVRSTLTLPPPQPNNHPSPTLLVEGDLGNPQSVSNEQSGLKRSCAIKGAKPPDTTSVQEPVSNRSVVPGNKDGGSLTEDAVKSDPQEPAGKKRESVETQGGPGPGGVG